MDTERVAATWRVPSRHIPIVRVTPLLAAMLTLVTAGCKPTIDDTYAALPPLGSTIPNFSYTTLDGATLSPDVLRGQPAVVALWASTCSASRLALTSMGALNADYASRGARVVVLADDRDRSAVAPLLASADIQAPVALAAGSLMDTFTHGQSVLPWRKTFAKPTFLVLDSAGRVVYRQIGIEQDASKRLGRVRAQLDSLLGKPPRASVRARGLTSR